MKFLFIRGSNTEMLQTCYNFPAVFLSITFLCSYLGIQKIFLYFCETAILLSKINQTLL